MGGGNTKKQHFDKGTQSSDAKLRATPVQPVDQLRRSPSIAKERISSIESKKASPSLTGRDEGRVSNGHGSHHSSRKASEAMSQSSLNPPEDAERLPSASSHSVKSGFGKSPSEDADRLPSARSHSVRSEVGKSHSEEAGRRSLKSTRSAMSGSVKSLPRGADDRSPSRKSATTPASDRKSSAGSKARRLSQRDASHRDENSSRTTSQAAPLCEFCDHCRKLKRSRLSVTMQPSWVLMDRPNTSLRDAIDLDKYDDDAVVDRLIGQHGHVPGCYDYGTYLTIEPIPEEEPIDRTYNKQPLLVTKDPPFRPLRTPLQNYEQLSRDDNRLNKPYTQKLFID